MERTGKLWLRKFDKELLIIGSICLFFWLLFVCEFDYGYKEAIFRVLEATLIAVSINVVFWIVEWLWAHWRTR